ncbi:MAG: DUF429 domain-containing protein [Deinococcota bacterium]
MTQIWGVDVTSAPRKRKPIVAVQAELNGRILRIQDMIQFTSLADVNTWLKHVDGVVGVDAPLGQPRRLLTHLAEHDSAWMQSWTSYVGIISKLSKAEFETLLNSYRADRPKGDKQHLRHCDKLAGACSPMMLYGVPVAKMFFALAPLLLCAKVDVPLLRSIPTSVCHVLEVYPALVVQALAKLILDAGQRVSYKSDTVSKQTQNQQHARVKMVSALSQGVLEEGYGLRLELPPQLQDVIINDPKGDVLDAAFAAVQAAWASQQDNFGIPQDADALEGWISDPLLSR